MKFSISDEAIIQVANQVFRYARFIFFPALALLLGFLEIESLSGEKVAPLTLPVAIISYIFFATTALYPNFGTISAAFCIFITLTLPSSIASVELSFIIIPIICTYWILKKSFLPCAISYLAPIIVAIFKDQLNEPFIRGWIVQIFLSIAVGFSLLITSTLLNQSQKKIDFLELESENQKLLTQSHEEKLRRAQLEAKLREETYRLEVSEAVNTDLRLREKVRQQLHDSVAMDLTHVVVGSAALATSVPQEYRKQIENLGSSARSAMIQLRAVMADLIPPPAEQEQEQEQRIPLSITAAMNIEKIIKICRTIIAPQNLNLVPEIEDEQLEDKSLMNLDPESLDLLHRTLREICMNALKYAQPGTDVKVSIARSDDSIDVSSTNFVAKKSHTGPLRGGVGLPALRRLLENAGGTLSYGVVNGRWLLDASYQIPYGISRHETNIHEQSTDGDQNKEQS